MNDVDINYINLQCARLGKYIYKVVLLCEPAQVV